MAAARKPAPKAAPAKGKFTKAADDRADRKAGIRENSPRDKALDKKRGVK